MATRKRTAANASADVACDSARAHRRRSRFRCRNIPRPRCRAAHDGRGGGGRVRSPRAARGRPLDSLEECDGEREQGGRRRTRRSTRCRRENDGSTLARYPAAASRPAAPEQLVVDLRTCDRRDLWLRRRIDRHAPLWATADRPAHGRERNPVRRTHSFHRRDRRREIKRLLGRRRDADRRQRASWRLLTARPSGICRSRASSGARYIACPSAHD